MLTGYKTAHFAEIDSTNAEARRRIAAGAAVPTVIHADRQTAGVGRRGRVWQSPAGNISCTIMQPLLGGLASVGQRSYIYGTAIARAANRFLPQPNAKTKWPNDVMIDGRKLAGVLLETSAAPDESLWLIAGFGVNVVAAPPVADGALYQSTALHLEGSSVDTDMMLREILLNVAALQAEYDRAGFAPLRAAWRALAMGMGKSITVNRPDGTQLHGIFNDIDDTGALVLAIGGDTHHISAGDIFLPPQAG
jgi:BirA family biotin operon repressor/biotin-[acetyl-CoA-carboxylase] ligase